MELLAGFILVWLLLTIPAAVFLLTVRDSGTEQEEPAPEEFLFRQ